MRSRTLMAVATAVAVALSLVVVPTPARASEDTYRITYNDDDGWIITARPDGSDERRLTGGWGQAWSPDGTRVAFTRTNRQDDLHVFTEIFAIDSDGSNFTQLTFGGGSSPVWSPDGTRIAYQRRVTGPDGLERGQIFVMNADGTDQRQITFGSLPNQFPAWSPDGRRIAYECVGLMQPDEYYDYTLCVIDADGSNRWIMTPYAIRPSWTADGEWIVYALAHTDVQIGIYDLWRIRADGSAPPEDLDFGKLHASFEPGGLWFGATYEEPGLLVSNADRSEQVWLTQGGLVGWQPVAPEQIGLVDPVTGIWRLRDGSGVVRSFYYGDPGDVPFMGDWDCDGTDTPGLYRQSDGYVYLRNSNTQGIADVSFYFGDPGDVPLAGDWNGDGCDTVSVYRPGEQRFYVINELGSADTGLGVADFSFGFGNPGDVPVAGDWDGDGITEVGLHRPESGAFYYRNTLTSGIADGMFWFGDPGDHLVSGDFGDGDGEDSPGVYRPSESRFYFRHSLTPGAADQQFTWGDADWLPVTGRFELDA